MFVEGRNFKKKYGGNSSGNSSGHVGTPDRNSNIVRHYCKEPGHKKPKCKLLKQAIKEGKDKPKNNKANLVHDSNAEAGPDRVLITTHSGSAAEEPDCPERLVAAKVGPYDSDGKQN